MSKVIALSRGKVAIVDEEDYERLAAYKWSALKTGRRREMWYAVRTEGGRGRQRMVLMHREIMNATPRINHRNGDGLDNRRENLRGCTQVGATLSARAHADKAGSKFKGVWWHKQRGKFVAEFRGKHLGIFVDERQAALAYDQAALAFDPQFARPNFAAQEESYV